MPFPAEMLPIITGHTASGGEDGRGADSREGGRQCGTHGVKPPCHVLGHFLQAAQP